MLLDLLAEWQACGVGENHIDPNTYTTNLKSKKRLRNVQIQKQII
jgi:hypothetical protein